MRIQESNWFVQRPPWATEQEVRLALCMEELWVSSTTEPTEQGSPRASCALSQTAYLGHSLHSLTSSLVRLRGWVDITAVSLSLRCIPYACSARISHLRSFWAWVTTSGLSSHSTTAVSAPTSTSVYKGRTVQTTEPRSFSTEVGAWLRVAVDPGQSSALLLRPVLKGLPL